VTAVTSLSAMADETTKTVDLDEMLSVAGDCGVYQVMVFLLIGIMQFVAIDAFAINFMAASTDHWCLVRPLHNFTTHQQKHISLPRDDSSTSGLSRCERYDVDWSSVNMSSWSPVNVSVTSCDEWSYDYTQFTSTIVTQVQRSCTVTARNCVSSRSGT